MTNFLERHPGLNGKVVCGYCAQDGFGVGCEHESDSSYGCDGPEWVHVGNIDATQIDKETLRNMIKKDAFHISVGGVSCVAMTEEKYLHWIKELGL